MCTNTATPITTIIAIRPIKTNKGEAADVTSSLESLSSLLLFSSLLSDIVILKELPEFIRNSYEAYVGCISGAILKDKYYNTPLGLQIPLYIAQYYKNNDKFAEAEKEFNNLVLDIILNIKYN